jgi:uncharacterized protein (TIGR03086 family)
MSTDGPSDQLESAESSLAVLQPVLAALKPDDAGKQTPCREFDVASLTDHLMNSITVIGTAAGAELPDRDVGAPVEAQVMSAARPTLDAWRRRGLDGMVSVGPNEAPAAVMAGILSLEFVVHAWDYASATGQRVDAPDSLCEYVLELSHGIITPEGRATVGFDAPIDVPAGSAVLNRLLAYTGRAG